MSDSFHVPGMVVTEHEFSVPLDYVDPSSATITVFARELADPDGLDRPYLVFFQGGPGQEATRPEAPPQGWIDRALRDYRVLLLDQRGTGRSTPVGTLPGMSPSEQADYLTHFRADSIVRDAELIRETLAVDRWSILGQSFGGFCSMTYLSLAPDSLREAFITGGLAPIGRSPDDVYERTYRSVVDRNEKYFRRYPSDRKRVDQILERLERDDVRLPSGDRLTQRRFRQLGSVLGMSYGAERLHYILERPAESPAFLSDVEAETAFARNPLYAILHESSYADGFSTKWSAGRLLPREIIEHGYFTGEHVFPWMFEEYSALRPLKEAAEILAGHPWPALYDAEVLKKNDVPAAAAVYAEDMYVDFELSMETARSIQGLTPWITNEFQHNGLRADGAKILGRLINVAHGRE